MSSLTKSYAAFGLLLALAGCSNPEPCKPMSVATVRLGGHVYAVPPEFNANFVDSAVDTSVSVEGWPKDQRLTGARARRIGHYCNRSPDPTPVVQTISTMDGTRQVPSRFALLAKATYVALEANPANVVPNFPNTDGHPWRLGLTRIDRKDGFEFFGPRLGNWPRPLGAVCSEVKSSPTGEAWCRVGTTSSTGDRMVVDLAIPKTQIEDWPEILIAADDYFNSIRTK